MRYFWELIVPYQMGELGKKVIVGLSKPPTNEELLKRYYQVGLKLLELEGKPSPDYNVVPDLGHYLSWDSQTERYELIEHIMPEDVEKDVQNWVKLHTMD